MWLRLLLVLRVGRGSSHSTSQRSRPPPPFALLPPVPLSLRSCDASLAQRSVCGMAYAMRFGRAIPGHDLARSVFTQDQVVALAETMPICAELERAGRGAAPPTLNGEEGMDGEEAVEEEEDEYE